MQLSQLQKCSTITKKMWVISMYDIFLPGQARHTVSPPLLRICLSILGWISGHVSILWVQNHGEIRIIWNTALPMCISLECTSLNFVNSKTRLKLSLSIISNNIHSCLHHLCHTQTACAQSALPTLPSLGRTLTMGLLYSTPAEPL